MLKIDFVVSSLNSKNRWTKGQQKTMLHPKNNHHDNDSGAYFRELFTNFNILPSNPAEDMDVCLICGVLCR
jgi:hypothetical protein